MNTTPFTVLLVEDDDGHATLIELNLRSAGLTSPVWRVSDGESALDYVTRIPSGAAITSLLVVLDLNLPVIDGYGVLRALKSQDKTRQIPVFILTSSDDRREIDLCYALGCNIYLTKPVDYQDFVFTIQRLGRFLSIMQFPLKD